MGILMINTMDMMVITEMVMIYSMGMMDTMEMVMILSTLVFMMYMTCMMMIVVTIILIQLRIITIFSSFQAQVGDPARMWFRDYSG